MLSREDPLRLECLALHDRLVDRTIALTTAGQLQIKDDFSLRFEVMVLLVAVVLYHLTAKNEKQRAEQLWEITFEGFESRLREQGVNDIRIAAKMRKLLLYATGRRNAYLAAIPHNDQALLRQAIGRNVLNGAEASDPRINLLLEEIQSNLLE